MGLTLTNVHETAKDPNTGMDRITGQNPYLRLKQGEAPPIFIQRGQAMDENGNIIRDLPDWFHEELAKVSPKMLAECGWKGKQEAKAAPAAPKAKKAAKPKTPKVKKPAAQPEPAPEAQAED